MLLHIVTHSFVYARNVTLKRPHLVAKLWDCFLNQLNSLPFPKKCFRSRRECSGKDIL